MQPTASTERIQIIDILRGWAIFGILVVNMLLDFSGYAAAPEAWTGTLDQAVVMLTRTLFRLKFVSLFTMLFGLGFYLQMTRAEAKGIKFLPLYAKRLLILLLFGLLHSLFFPFSGGDILHQYALIGALLPIFRVRSNRSVLLAVVALTLLPFAFQAVSMGSGQSDPPAAEVAQEKSAEVAEGEEISTWPPRPDARLYAEASIGEIVAHHTRQFLRTRTSMIGYLWMLPLLALFLLGFLVAKRRILEDVPAHLPLLRRMVWWGLFLGLGLTAVAVPLGSSGSPWLGLLAGLSFTIGGPCLAAFYAGTIVLLAQKTVWKRLLAPLAAVGRMALTNYLLQTLICASIFFGFGLGLYGTVGPAAGFALTIVIFAFQIVFSHWWMERFRFGPVEWLWRTLTYGRVQEMRNLPKAKA